MFQDATDHSALVSLAQFQELSRKVQTLGARVKELEGAFGASKGRVRDDSDLEAAESLTGIGGPSWKSGISRSNDASVSQPASEMPYRGTSPPFDVASGTATSPITARRHMADDEMVFALEDYQMSRRVNTVRNLDDTVEGKADDAAASSPDHIESPPVLDSNATRVITEDHPMAFLVPPNTDYLALALTSLPEQQVCEVLVQRYFDNVEWFQRVRCLPFPADAQCLHYPTFIRQCRQFWADGSGGPLSLSPDFVCTYLMVICLGLAFSDAPDSIDLLALAERLYHVAEVG